MTYEAPSVISAVNITYGRNKDSQLLSVAQDQDEVLLDQNGFAIAKDIALGKAEAFYKKSIELTDGAKGDEGALGILRANHTDGDIAVVFKYTAQGLGHGHFDKLAYSYYDGAVEALQDYGAARWVNIDQKAGGRYLKENKSWAKQTIAHNTIVVDATSHFQGKYDLAVDQHSTPYLFDSTDGNAQIASAKETNAYANVDLQRTLVLIKDEAFHKPILLDIFAAFGEAEHQYDLPFQFQEHLLKTDIEYKIADQLNIMGDSHGYQHLWQEASGQVKDQFQFSWVKSDLFFTMTALAGNEDKVIFARLGANDPNFNLRRDALLIHRKPKTKDAFFATAIESHGVYSRVSEVPLNPYAFVKSLEKVFHDKNYSAVKLTSLDDQSWTVMIANNDAEPSAKHQLIIEEKIYKWEGPFQIIKK